MMDERMTADFNHALRLRDAGRLNEAIEILLRLAEEAPHQTSVIGMLAGLQFQAQDYESAAATARSATILSPRSGLASIILFHSLNELGKMDDAFAELMRFRRLAHYNEYDVLLTE